MPSKKGKVANAMSPGKLKAVRVPALLVVLIPITLGCGAPASERSPGASAGEGQTPVKAEQKPAPSRVLSSPALSADRERPNAISVEDIGAKVTLVGRLGEPLGKMMEVKGTWGYPDARAKDFSLRFRVSHVNGKRLPKLVEFNVAQLQVRTAKGKNAIPKFDEHKTLEGMTWTLRAYETGRFHIVPEDKELGTALAARPYWYETFTSELVGVVQR